MLSTGRVLTQMMYLRGLIPGILVCLLGLGFLSLRLDPIYAAEENSAKNGKEKEKWDVQNPEGPKKNIQLKTKSFTWSDVDVSPDGKSLVFDVLGDLYLVPITGGKAKPLTSGMAYDYQARFSPDGKSLAFVSDREGADNIWMMDLASKKLKKVTSESNNSLHNPSFSPDGQYIVARKSFLSTRSIPGGEIWIYHIQGGDGAQVRELLHGKGTQKNIAEPAYSVDGRYLYYSLDATEGKTWQYNKNSTQQIFVIRRWDLQKGEEEDITGGAGGAIRPVPSPDGKSLAFIKRVDFESALYLKDLASGEEKQVYLGLDRDLQESDGTLGNAPHFAFTPDSQNIVFWTKGKIHTLNLASKKFETLNIEIENQLQVMNVAQHSVDVDPDTFEVKMPRWVQKSPDQKSIIFQALGYLYQKDLRSGQIKRLTTQTDEFEFYPAFSRDGRQLAFTTWNDNKLGAIKIFDLKSGLSKTINQEPGHYVEVQFSPSGDALVYRKLPEGYLLDRRWSEEPGLYLQKLDGTKPVKLQKEGAFPHFAAGEDRIYWLKSMDPTGVELLSCDRSGKDVVSHAKGEDITQILVSPDGRWLAFNEQFRVYLTPFLKTGKSLNLSGESKIAQVRALSKQAGEFLVWTPDSQELMWSQGSKQMSLPLNQVFPLINDTSKELPKEFKPRATPLDFKVASDKPKGDIALVGAKIVTMRNADKTQEVIEDGVVLIRDSRIAAIGSRQQVKIPQGVTEIDVKGKTIIPGLIDAHAHGPQGSEELTPQQNWKNYSSLSFGVTTIHDPSNDTSEIFSAAELQKAGLTVAPRIFSTGSIIYGALGAGYASKIESYEDALFHVQRLKDVGAISVKSYQQPRRSQRQMLIKAGRELGIFVIPEGGSKFQYNMGMIADGHRGIEHALPLHDIYDDVLQLWSATDVAYTPTFVVAYGGLAGEKYWYDRTEVWKNNRLMSFVPRFVVEPSSVRRETAPDHHYNHFAVARTAKQLRDLGVRIHIGAHGQREGLAAHWELWMMQQGGMSPWEALRAGTIDGAKYFGMEADIGSLELGKLADLAVIDGDVLQDIRLSERVSYTMLNGRLYDAASMNEIGLRPRARQPFYFEQHPTTGMQPIAHKIYQEKAERFHWVH